MVLQNFDEHLREYAILITKIGANIQKEDTVLISASVDQAQLVRLLTKEAYHLGAIEVIVDWEDEEIIKEFLVNTKNEIINEVPAYKSDRTRILVDKKVTCISIVSQNPDAFVDIDPQRVGAYQFAQMQSKQPLIGAIQSKQVRWTVAAAASVTWADKVFPSIESAEEQVDKLWDEIFRASLVYMDDPLKAWKDHNQSISERIEYFNEEQFSSLHYVAPGTDLTIGLLDNHIWEGGAAIAADGNDFVANIPTEEIFTAPDRNKIDGYVTTTKPLLCAGTILKDIQFTFENGELVKYKTENGNELLSSLLETDEGAKFLGEVALVPDDSPISNSGVTFFNTLFDENASTHLAFGAAYPFNLNNGEKMTEDELQNIGLNRSQIHMDFMIGSSQMNVEAIRKDGSKISIIKNGNWN